MDADPDFSIDSNHEIFLVVDVKTDGHPVLVWSSTGDFSEVCGTFDEFVQSLEDWPLEDE